MNFNDMGGGGNLTDELIMILTNYAKHKDIVRMNIPSNSPMVADKESLLRVTEVGKSTFCAQLIDSATMEPLGMAHLPISWAKELYCLEADNKWRDLEKAFAGPDAQR